MKTWRGDSAVAHALRFDQPLSRDKCVNERGEPPRADECGAAAVSVQFGDAVLLEGDERFALSFLIATIQDASVGADQSRASVQGHANAVGTRQRD